MLLVPPGSLRQGDPVAYGALSARFALCMRRLVGCGAKERPYALNELLLRQIGSLTLQFLESTPDDHALPIA